MRTDPLGYAVVGNKCNLHGSSARRWSFGAKEGEALLLELPSVENMSEACMHIYRASRSSFSLLEVEAC